MKKIIILALTVCLCGVFSSCAKEECAHQLSAATTKEATCKNTGLMTYTCGSCGIQFTVETPAVEHTFTETVTREATCTEAGVLTHTCTVCGEIKEEPIPLRDHTFDFYSPDPSCCTVCGQMVEGGGVDTSAANPWYGKQWVALGTSLTSEAQGKYTVPLAQRSGMEVTNYGVPGGTAIGHVLQSAQTAELSSADLVTIEFGVNDWVEGVPLGTAGDTVPYLATVDQWSNGGNETGTFAGACYQIFKTVQERASGAVVVFLTEPTGQSVTESGENCARERTNYLGLRQKDYSDMAVAVAQYMGVSVIDAGSTSMIGQEHPQYLADQIHHTDLGGKQYALTVWMELKDIAPLLKEN